MMPAKLAIPGLLKKGIWKKVWRQKFNPWHHLQNLSFDLRYIVDMICPKFGKKNIF